MAFSGPLFMVRVARRPKQSFVTASEEILVENLAVFLGIGWKPKVSFIDMKAKESFKSDALVPYSKDALYDLLLEYFDDDDALDMFDES